jgi:protein TonB
MIRILSVGVMVVAMLAPLSAFQEPYKVGGDVTSPKVSTKVEPQYTEEAKTAKVEGAVVLSVVVDRTGVPRDIQVVKPLGSGLDESAKTAVSQWRFEPGTKDGQAVDVVASIEVNFRLL